MNGNKLRVIAGAIIMMASIAAPLVILWRALKQGDAQEALVQQRAVQIEEILADNKRLSKLLSHRKNSSLSEQQFHELLKLRGEIGQLRREADEVAKLNAKKERLLEEVRKCELPNPNTALAYWPKAQLASAGYADPTSALETSLWAMRQSSADGLEASLSSEAKSNLAETTQIMALWVMSRNDPEVRAGRVAPENATYGSITENLSSVERKVVQATAASDSLGTSSGFYVLGQTISGDEAVFDVYFEGERKIREVGFKKINNEWKLDGIYLSGAKTGNKRVRVWP